MSTGQWHITTEPIIGSHNIIHKTTSIWL